jgi:hypothetical protein
MWLHAQASTTAPSNGCFPELLERSVIFLASLQQFIFPFFSRQSSQ